MVNVLVAVLVVVALLSAAVLVGRASVQTAAAETSVVGHLRGMVADGLIEKAHLVAYVEALIDGAKAVAKRDWALASWHERDLGAIQDANPHA